MFTLLPAPSASCADQSPAAFGQVVRLSASELAPVAPADWGVFQSLCEAFLAQDDPYLEARTLSDLCAEHDWNERKFAERLEDFARLGWLRLGRPMTGGNRGGFDNNSRPGEGLALVEITFAGLDVYCRAAGRVNYPELVREVASCLVHEDHVDTGSRLRGALLSAGARISRAVPDLLLAHAVEALAQVGLLETCQQWGGTLGFQIGCVAPELRRWVEVSDDADDAPLLAAA